MWDLPRSGIEPVSPALAGATRKAPDLVIFLLDNIVKFMLLSEFFSLSLMNALSWSAVSYLGFNLTPASLVYKVSKGKSKSSFIIGLFYSKTKVWLLGFY